MEYTESDPASPSVFLSGVHGIKPSLSLLFPVEYTESGPSPGQLCHFPFVYNSRLYSSCAEGTDRGPAWCATNVTDDQQVDGDSWGFCSPRGEEN